MVSVHGSYRSSLGLDKKMLPSKPPKTTTTSDPSTTTTTTVLVGPKQVAFKVDKKLLCAASPFFQEQLLEDAASPKTISLWLPGESAAMFALFVEWVHAAGSFRAHLDEAIATAHETSEQASQDIHWAMIRLHLFASGLGLHELQDLAMDAVQDLYLRCDWDVAPSLITFLYTKCEALSAVRLRRWAVAMVAFSLSADAPPASVEQHHNRRRQQQQQRHHNLRFHPQDAETSDPSCFHALLDDLPEFAADYDVHSRKMAASGLDVRFKNPQLRIPANKLRNEERAFGFRQCSFHSHRAIVGQHRCPHVVREARRRRDEMAAAPYTHPVSASDSSSSSSEDDFFDLHDRNGLAKWGMGLTAPSRRQRDAASRSAVARRNFIPGAMEGEEEAVQKALKHVRSISSTLNV